MADETWQPAHVRVWIKTPELAAIYAYPKTVPSVASK